MIIRNAALLQVIFIVNVARHVQLPSSTMFLGPLKLPKVLEGGITSEKPPAVFWHRRSGLAKHSSGTSAACGRLFGEKEKDLVARPSRTDLERKAVALAEMGLLRVYEEPSYDFSALNFTFNDSFPDETRAGFLVSDTSPREVKGTFDLVSRPSEEELRDKALALGYSGYPDEVTAQTQELPDLGSAFSDLSHELSLTQHHGVEGKKLLSTEQLELQSSLYNQTKEREPRLLGLSMSDVLGAEGLLFFFLEILLFLLDLCLADLYVAWLCGKLHPQNLTEAKAFLSTISDLQSSVIKGLSIRDFSSTWSRLCEYIKSSETLSASAAVVDLDNLCSRHDSEKLLGIICECLRSNVDDGLRILGMKPLLTRLVILSSPISKSFLLVAEPALNKLGWVNILFEQYAGRVLEQFGSFVMRLCCRPELLMSRIRDKMCHGCAILITNLRPVRRGCMLVLQAIQVLWEIVKPLRLRWSRVPIPGNISDEQTGAVPSDQKYRAGVGVPRGRWREARERMSENGDPFYPPAKLIAWREEQDLRYHMRRSSLVQPPSPTPSTRSSIGGQDPLTPSSWRQPRSREASGSEYSLGSPRPPQFVRGLGRPPTEANTADSWRSKSTNAEGSLGENRRASLDMQALKRKDQFRTMVKEFLPRYLAQESGNGDAQGKSAKSSSEIPEGAVSRNPKETTNQEASESSVIPVFDFETGKKEGNVLSTDTIDQDTVPYDGESEEQREEPLAFEHQLTYRDALLKDMAPSSFQRGWSVEPEPEPEPAPGITPPLCSQGQGRKGRKSVQHEKRRSDRRLSANVPKSRNA